MNLRLLILPALLCSASSQANLVLDPSFEGDPPFSWHVTPAAQGSGWGDVNDPHTGEKAFSFFGQNNDFIYQDIILEIGVTYEVSFWIKNYGIGDDALSANLYGGDGLNDIGMNPVSTPLEEWVQLSFTSVAVSTEGRIGFHGRDQISSILIDDISVEAVPEPATLSVLAGIAAIIKRRKSR